MAASVFDDKAKAPAFAELEQVLGSSSVLLKEIEQHLGDQLGEMTREWKFYGKKAGWTLAFICKERTVMHLIPRSGLFTVIFTLGRQAVSAVRECDLPPEILSAVENAYEYAEGRSVRFDVASTGDVAIVRKLAAIKMAH